ncbi:tumor necrosis factor receptor superfamily member 9 [Ornithorhynchus anatinus]|uniref:TNF receptor superfamily member 9 n=1 Tax=Ornithorhynchus anatinus TaxID=9258 RepID=A0A6I8PHS3_ORNAN|nr:tumor necrosis factor receptor superfamily member 9 [Ornithorhynchus anatinus]
MGRAFCKLVATVLLVIHLGAVKAWQDCSCPAGTFLNDTNCGKNKHQVCLPCPPNSFSSTNGQQTTCDRCKKCQGIFQLKRACTATQNAECVCINGYHCSGKECSMCEKDCKEGQELTRKGCKDCGYGTFNNRSYGMCREWTNCSLAGKVVLQNGTQMSDVVCGKVSTDFSPDAFSVTIPSVFVADKDIQVFTITLALIMASSVFLVLLITFCFCITIWSKKKLPDIFKQTFIKPVQTAQEEDACSCRFPEEEEGECSDCCESLRLKSELQLKLPDP